MITVTSCFGVVSYRENVALYHSLVSAPRNSKFDPWMTREEVPLAFSPASCPVHVPLRVAESDLCGFDERARVQTSFQGLLMPIRVRTSPSILILNFEDFPMSSLVLSLANSTFSRYSV